MRSRLLGTCVNCKEYIYWRGFQLKTRVKAIGLVSYEKEKPTPTLELSLKSMAGVV